MDELKRLLKIENINFMEIIFNSNEDIFESVCSRIHVMTLLCDAMHFNMLLGC